MGAEGAYTAFLRITVHTPVYIDDFRRIGRVKQIRDGYFEVATGWLRRDYWLPAEVVAEAVPDQSVVLNLNRTQVQARKVHTPPDEQTVFA